MIQSSAPAAVPAPVAAGTAAHFARSGELTAASASVSPWLGRDPHAPVRLGHTVAATAERRVKAHAHLYLEGQKQSHVYLVLEGVVGQYKVLADGRRQITSFAYPGDMIGLDCPHVHGDSAEALSDVRVRAIPLNAIDRLIENEAGFGQALLRIVAAELADTRERLVCLGRQSAAEKLAGFLVRIARREASLGGDGVHVRLPMKRSDIADFLGLTIETVSRNFTRLRTARVIRMSSTTELEILDPGRLAAIACGEDGERHH